MLREAAQQALEALEATHYDVGSAEKQRLQTMDAITALRDALAQQTQTPCDIAEDGVCEVIDCCRKLPQILEALEIGYDSAQAEAAQYHAAMEGYRPERHAEMDADVQKIAEAITALRAALVQQEHEPTARYKCTVVDDRHPNGVPFEQWVNAPQQEQAEPVLVVEKEPDYMSRGHFYEGSKPFIDPTEVWKLPIGTKLYTTPPRREWQSLSEEEIDRWTPEIHPVIRAIEAALKEKNA
jgi:hypothetical protein